MAEAGVRELVHRGGGVTLIADTGYGIIDRCSDAE